MDEMPDSKPTSDDLKGALISPLTRYLSGQLPLLATAWAGTTIIFCLSAFFVPSPWARGLVWAAAAVNLICLAGVFRIIRRANRGARELTELAAMSRDLVWQTDETLIVNMVFGPVEAVTGRSARAISGGRLTDLLSAEDARALQALTAESRPFAMAAEIRRPGNGTLAVEISGERTGNAYRGVIRDITRQKLRRAREQRQQDMLDRSEKLRHLGVLAGSVAHDLNNILSGIATYPEVMLLDDTLDPKVRQGLTMIKDSGRKASSVVSDLLTISRGIKADKQLLNVNTVIERFMAAAEFQKIQDTFAGVEIETVTEPELLNISGSYIHIEKAVMNLMLNAVEETAGLPGGKVVLSTANHYVDPIGGSPEEEDLSPGEYVRLSVADNGAGIPEDCLDKIFDPFFTQKEMGRSGTGLGLTVVENAARDHNGVIRVKSGADGTRFDLFFPAIREELPKTEAPESLDEIRGSGERLLIVDDLSSQRKIAATILKNLGYTVFSVADGVAAEAFVRKNPVDLLVLDMIMAPAISGLETYRRIKKIYPRQKAIIASGHSESEDVLKAQELGAGSFVKKPYTILDMGIAVKEELET